MSCALPNGARWAQTHAQAGNGELYNGTYWVFLHAAGGWDPTMLCDPKGRASDNESIQ
ncbi:MAG: hypothetical protein R3A47_04910 [Polyangiales bacterium]